jgi:plastocyanin
MTHSRYVLAAALVAIAPAVWLHAGAAPSVIAQKDRTFTPSAVTVKAGATLTFKNDDDVTHNSYSTSKGNEFNSKAQQPGETATVTFKTAGEVEIRCAFHPKMKMTVTVQ